MPNGKSDVEAFAEEHGISVEEAARLLVLQQSNPNDPELKTLSPEDRQALSTAAGEIPEAVGYEEFIEFAEENGISLAEALRLLSLQATNPDDPELKTMSPEDRWELHEVTAVTSMKQVISQFAEERGISESEVLRLTELVLKDPTNSELQTLRPEDLGALFGISIKLMRSQSFQDSLLDAQEQQEEKRGNQWEYSYWYAQQQLKEQYERESRQNSHNTARYAMTASAEEKGSSNQDTLGLLDYLQYTDFPLSTIYHSIYLQSRKDLGLGISAAEQDFLDYFGFVYSSRNPYIGYDEKTGAWIRKYPTDMTAWEKMEMMRGKYNEMVPWWLDAIYSVPNPLTFIPVSKIPKGVSLLGKIAKPIRFITDPVVEEGSGQIFRFIRRNIDLSDWKWADDAADFISDAAREFTEAIGKSWFTEWWDSLWNDDDK